MSEKKTLRRFLAFAGEMYEEAGGWGDLLGAFDSLEEAESAAINSVQEDPGKMWWHVVDLRDMEIVNEHHRLARVGAR